MPKDNLLSSITAYYAGLPKELQGRDLNSIEAKIAETELHEHLTQNKAILDYYAGLDAKANIEADKIAQRFANLADKAPETPTDPDILDTTP